MKSRPAKMRDYLLDKFLERGRNHLSRSIVIELCPEKGPMLMLLPEENLDYGSGVSAIVKVQKPLKFCRANRLIANLYEPITGLVHTDKIADLRGLAARGSDVEGFSVEDVPGFFLEAAELLFDGSFRHGVSQFSLEQFWILVRVALYFPDSVFPRSLV